MTENTKYKVERKEAGLLPRLLSRWRTLEREVDFSNVQNYLRENFHFALMGFRQIGEATILEYMETPPWSSEEYRRYHTMREIGTVAPVENNVFYRVTPPITVSFKEM